MSSTRHCMDTTVWRRSAVWRLHTRYLYVILDRWVTARLIAGIHSATPSCQPLLSAVELLLWGPLPGMKPPTSLDSGLEISIVVN